MLKKKVKRMIQTIAEKNFRKKKKKMKISVKLFGDMEEKVNILLEKESRKKKKKENEFKKRKKEKLIKKKEEDILKKQKERNRTQ